MTGVFARRAAWVSGRDVIGLVEPLYRPGCSSQGRGTTGPSCNQLRGTPFAAIGADHRPAGCPQSLQPPARCQSFQLRDSHEALSLEHGELSTKGQVLQDDILKMGGRNEKTKQRTPDWKKSIVFSLMRFWRMTRREQILGARWGMAGS
jgi:hypothetical protein